MNLHLTPLELTDWISSAHKGDRIVYHLGHLMHDKAFRVSLAATGGTTTITNVPLNAIADAAFEAYKAGFIVLAQQRVAEDIYRYLAIRTKKYAPAPMVQPKEN